MSASSSFSKTEGFSEGLSISGGLLSLYGLPGRKSLSARLEVLIKDASELSGIYLYPELALSSQAFTFFARGIVCTDDASPLLMLGSSWKPYQGLSLSAFIAGSFGKAGTVFSADKAGAYSAVLSAGFVY
jgi:hypothetical protein